MRLDDQPADAGPEVTLRIPGVWHRPEEFFQRLPRGCRCTERGLLLADGSEFELHARPADDEFPRIFAGACPKLPTEEERHRIENYTTNICLIGRGGSVDAAVRLMEAAAAVLTAGGAGVFVDNCGIAHGATDWLALLEGARDGGVYWAFALAVQSDDVVYSMGMHVLGLRDAEIPATGNREYDARALHSFLGFTAFSGAALRDGDVVDDPVLPTFCARAQADHRSAPNVPMHNPYGRWRLELLDEQRN